MVLANPGVLNAHVIPHDMRELNSRPCDVLPNSYAE